MPINEYNHLIDYLWKVDLPNYFSTLHEQMTKPIPMAKFSRKGIGVSRLVSEFGLDGDFSGCYVLLKKSKPVYVGISRFVLKRLRQHVLGKTQNEASLAYKIASVQFPGKLTRIKAMRIDKFVKLFEDAKKYIQDLSVAFVRIENPLILYIFEPYCAIKLNTLELNSFETH